MKKILFVPYAIKGDFDIYLNRVAEPLVQRGFEVESLHNYADEIKAVKEAEAIFVGGGNTYQLLYALYEKNLMEIMRSTVLFRGVPYMGFSAGINGLYILRLILKTKPHPKHKV